MTTLRAYLHKYHCILLIVLIHVIAICTIYRVVLSHKKYLWLTLLAACLIYVVTFINIELNLSINFVCIFCAFGISFYSSMS